jgi:predicted transcriptional regulator
MSAVSLRLPDHLEQQLNEEARLSGQPRSQLMREALRLAAEALASDAGACGEAQGMAADFLMAENEALAGAEAPANAASAEPWWR